MTNTELLDLLREARTTFRCPNTPRVCACIECTLRAHIDAALAEQQDSAKDVVESVVFWWQDKVIRAVINGRQVTIQTNAPNHWFWSVAFVDRKDQYGMCERRDGVCTTEADAKSAAIAAAKGMR
jgi:hypothetical protein